MIKNATIKNKITGQVVETAEELPSGTALKEHIRESHGPGKYLVTSTGTRVVDGSRRRMPIQETIIVSGQPKQNKGYGAMSTNDATLTIFLKLIEDLKNRLDMIEETQQEINEKVSVIYHDITADDSQEQGQKEENDPSLMAAFAELQAGVPIQDLIKKYPHLVAKFTGGLGG